MYKYNPLIVGKLDQIGANELNDLDDVNTAGTVNGKVLTYQSGTWLPEAAAGGGDMLKAEYVTGAGTVYNASRLGGDTLATVQAHNVAASKITSGTIGLARIPAVDDARIPDLETLSYGGAFAEGQIPNLAASKITSGTFNVNLIDMLANLKGTVTAEKVAALPAAKITSGTLAVARQETLDNLNGTVALAQIPTMDDAHIPNVDGLSYGGAFATAQIPSLAASKTTSGTFNSNRIPALPTSRITSGTFNANRIPVLPTSRITTGTFNLNRIPSVDDARIPDLDTLSYGAAFATAQVPSLGAYKITTGTFTAARIPALANLKGTVTDAKIPNLETLSYGAAFATAQIPAIGAYKITSGTLAVERHETLDNLNGTVTLSQIPTMDDGHIPDLDTLSYAAAFATAQIPGVGAYKISAGTLNADRIPSLPTSRITTGTFNSARIPDVGVVAINYVIDGGGAAITAGTVGFLEVPFACHVDRWTLMADQHGSFVVDIWRDSYANFPPLDADSMPGTTNMPAISGTTVAQGTDLSGWGTQGISSGDILAYHVDACTSIELCTIALKVTKK